MARKSITERLTGGGAPVFDPRLMERSMRAMEKIMQEHGFASAEQANKFLKEFQAEYEGQVPVPPPVTPEEQAQELFYQALQAKGKKRIQLAKQAIEVYPDCTDAYVLLAEEEAKTTEEARDLFERGVAGAERSLPPEYLSDSKLRRSFWGILETRPYMRARTGLAHAMWAMDERDAAIDHLESLLRLNPDDNMGQRYFLVCWLTAVGRDSEARQLLQDYSLDEGTVFAYMRALLGFRKHGPSENARKKLRKAFEANPYVPMILVLLARPPKGIEHSDIFEVSDALAAIYAMAEAWDATSGWFQWFSVEFIKSLEKGWFPLEVDEVMSFVKRKGR